LWRAILARTTLLSRLWPRSWHPVKRPRRRLRRRPRHGLSRPARLWPARDGATVKGAIGGRQRAEEAVGAG